MTDFAIYKDIAERTDGDVYIGVVGPVRTGKSTFIRKFMENAVLPNIKEENEEKRARDEMPQSAAGKSIMTTEPKFVPEQAVNIEVGEYGRVSVKMIDCVGYIVPEAIGQIEEGQPRMVMTPWASEPMPFEKAAETGTQRVINEHSTIGVLVTTDGSIGEISRQSYIEAENRVVNELKKINKPFVIILNSAHPENSESVKLAYELEEKYQAPVALVNCLELDKEDIDNILNMVLLEFPVKEIKVNIPGWINALDDSHKLKNDMIGGLIECASVISKVGQINGGFNVLAQNENIKEIKYGKTDLGKGSTEIDITVDDTLFYKTVGELTGLDIENEEQLISKMTELSEIKNKYEKVSKALDDVESKGYGIVTPDIEDLKLEEPEIIKTQGSYGVKLKASAPSVHMIKANIQTELNPVVGTEKESEELIKYLLKEFEEDPKKIWESNMFGKSLYELINEGLNTKLSHMPDDARLKLGDTLQKLINEGSGGLICIIL